MLTTRRAGEKPKNVKNFSLAFFILTLVMVATQSINFIVTLLPAAQETVLDVGDGTTVSVASLQNTYSTVVIFVLLVYGLTWFWVTRSNNWARWIAIVLSVLAVIGGAQGLITTLAAGATDMVGLALSLAQLLAAGWVLALAFRHDVHEWFKRSTVNPSAL
ncbi:MAG TPA: hypothetical protein VIG82_03330 [Enteractinococcus sp.]